jgi:GTP cyclohydrolase I
MRSWFHGHVVSYQTVLSENIADGWLKAHEHVTWYKVEAENFESIHNHNAYASIEKG